MRDELSVQFGVGARTGALLAGLVILLAACGGGTAARPTPSSSSPTTTAPPGLFVTLQASTGHLWSQDPNTRRLETKVPDRIAIVGRDGRVYAQATFTPQPTPWILPDLGPVLPAIAHMAAGRAYFIDGNGVVRSLGWNGAIREETRFPITSSQQTASFAVSPDGKSLVGSVVTFPPKPSPEPAAPYQPQELYRMDVMAATAGSAATVTYHEQWYFKDRQSSGAQLMGWDPQGPVAVYPTALGTQGDPVRQYFGRLVRFPDGKPGQPVPVPDGGSIGDLLPSGSYVSLVGDMTGSTLLVTAADGSTLWSYRTAEGFTNPFLAPDLQHVAALANSDDQVIGRDGTVANLPNGFRHSGWLDAGTVIGYPNGLSPQLGYVSLSSMARAVDIGLEGTFAGSLS